MSFLRLYIVYIARAEASAAAVLKLYKVYNFYSHCVL